MRVSKIRTLSFQNLIPFSSSFSMVKDQHQRKFHQINPQKVLAISTYRINYQQLSRSHKTQLMPQINQVIYGVAQQQLYQIKSLKWRKSFLKTKLPKREITLPRYLSKGLISNLRSRKWNLCTCKRAITKRIIKASLQVNRALLSRTYRSGSLLWLLRSLHRVIVLRVKVKELFSI